MERIVVVAVVKCWVYGSLAEEVSYSHNQMESAVNECSIGGLQVIRR